MKRSAALSFLIVFSLILSLFPSAVLALPSSPGQTEATDTVAGSDLPLLFVENAGQFDERARFQVQAGGETAWLCPDSIWLTVQEAKTNPSDESGNFANLRLSLTGSNPSPLVEPFGRMETKVSYFLGSDPSEWRADVPVWSGVRYKDIYPGVDLELRGDGGKLSMNWVVTNDVGPASLQSSRLKVEGGEIASVAKGIVEIETLAGPVAIPLPRVKGAGRDFAGLSKPSVTGDELTAPYSTAATGATPSVTTGPGLVYSTYLGGSQYDIVSAVAVDDAGACYSAGLTMSSDFPTTPGVVKPTNSQQNAFVVKLNSAGTAMVYATYLGGTYEDQGKAIKVDDAGNVFVAGYTDSADFPTTTGAYSRVLNNCDLFLTKLNSTGTALEYSTLFGGSGVEALYEVGLVLDDGTACIATSTQSPDLPVTSNAYQTSHSGYLAGAVIKLSTELSGTDCLIYSSYLGEGRCSSLDISSDGKLYTAGITDSSSFPTTTGAFDQGHNGYYDGFFAIIDPDSATGPGSLIYSSYIGGIDDDTAYGVACDSIGGAYITGWTLSANFPAANGFDSSYNGNADAYVIKLNPTGNGANDLVYSTFIGGADSGENGTAIAVEDNGSACLTGVVSISDENGSNLPVTPGSFDTTAQSGTDGFVAKISPDGANLSYSTYLGGGYTDLGRTIAVDSGGGMYIGGETDSPDFPTTAGAPFTTRQGYVDGFVTKLVGMEDLEPGIIAPAAGEAVPSGSLYQLKWVGPDGAKTFKIKYSTDKGKTWKLIAKNITETAYSWSVPEPLNNKNNCIFKVQSFTETGVALPVFKSPFIIEVVKLTSPEGPGLTLTSGNTATITWSINDTAKPIKKLKLTYTKNGGLTWLPIAEGVITDTAVIEGGTFAWVVPYVGTTSKTKCKVMVKLLSSNGTVIGKDTSDANFVIEAVPVAVSSPNGGEEIWAASTQEISWSAPLNVGKFKLEYSTNNGTTWKLIEKDVTGTSYDWTLPTQDGNKTNSRVKVTGYTSAGAVVASDKSDSVFTIQTLKLTAPNSGNPTLSTGDSYTVTWETNGLKTEPAKVKLTYSKDGGATWLPVDGGVIKDPVAIASGTFNWTVPSVGVNPKTKCKVMVKLLSSTGVVLAKDVSDSNFTISPWL